MNTRRFYHTLRFKLTATMVVLLVFILGSFSYLQYTRHRQVLINNLERSMTNLGEVIESSLQPAMLTQESTEIQQAIDAIAEREEIEDIFLLNKEGEVRFSPLGQGVGTKPPLSDPGCQPCHRPGLQHQSFSAIFVTPEGKRVIRNCNPINNEAACQSCHEPRDEFNGILITDFSMADTDRHLAADLRNNLLWSAGAILAVILAMNLMMDRLVVAKLQHFLEPIKRFSQGDFVSRVTVSGKDEIGELADSFNRMAEDLANARELQNSAVLQERDRIAREIHDGLAQVLGYVNTKTLAVRKLLSSGKHTEAEAQLAQLEEAAREMYAGVRQAILDLRISASPKRRFMPTLKEYLYKFSQQSGIKTELVVSDQEVYLRFAPAAEIQLIRIVQEALTNVRKHARASRAWVRFTVSDGNIQMTIEDNGQGFDPSHMARGDWPQFGLQTMKERAEATGGTFELESSPGQGTKVQVTIPLSWKEG